MLTLPWTITVIVSLHSIAPPVRGRDLRIHIRATRICPTNKPLRIVGRGLRFRQQHHGDVDGRGRNSGQHVGEYIQHTCPPFNNDRPACVGNAVTRNKSTGDFAAYGHNANKPLLQPHGFPAPHTTPFHMPPIQKLQIPAQGNFNPGTPPFNAGGRYNARGYGQIGQCAGGRGHGRGRQHRGHLPFAEQMARGGRNPGTTGALYNPNVQCMTHSNINKLYGNWNACYSCGFDIKDGHTLKTYPRDWHKPTHIKAFTRGNAQSYIAAGYDCCTRGMHKTIPPNAAF